MYKYMYIFRDLESGLSKTKSVLTWKMVNPAWEGQTLVEGSWWYWRSHRSLCLQKRAMDQPNNLAACFPQDGWNWKALSGKANDWRNLRHVVLNQFSHLKIGEIQKFLWWTSEARANRTWANFGKQNWRWPPCVASKTPPCVRSKRPRVYQHHAHMFQHMCAWFRHTRGRFWSRIRFFPRFSACRKHTPRPPTTPRPTTTHTTQHKHTTSHGDRERDRERKQWKRDRERETRQEKTREDDTRQQDKKRWKRKREEKRWKTREETRWRREWRWKRKRRDKMKKRRENMKGKMKEKMKRD